MSELINNREYRKKIMRQVILDLHDGKPLEAVKAKFDEVIKDLAPGELSLLEQGLINEGLPIEEVQRLCDVHAAVFRNAIENTPAVESEPGHPIDIMKQENQAIEKLVEQDIKPLLAQLKAGAQDERPLVLKLTEKVNLLWDVDKHYSRKENLIFPYLEKYEITGPPKVMWGVDDEIRAGLKAIKAMLADYQPEHKEQLITKAEQVLNQISEMVFKEEKILLPMALETLTEDEWYQILKDSDEFGYCLVEPKHTWKPARTQVAKGQTVVNEHTKGQVKFETGMLTPQEISNIFTHLPVDITYVDKDDVVKFFSANKERIFPRTRTIIGRKVENCHPPASVQIVEQLVNDFKQGRKDSEAFWIKMGEKYVYIKYIAVRDEQGVYQGTLEVTQDIKPLQEISGEKRIMD